MNIRYDGRPPTFDEVYPRAPYAELILHAPAGWLRGFIGRRRAPFPQASQPARVTPGPRL